MEHKINNHPVVRTINDRDALLMGMSVENRSEAWESFSKGCSGALTCKN